MSKKIEKLKEINKTINVIINRLETQIFVENISEIYNNKNKTTQSKDLI